MVVSDINKVCIIVLLRSVQLSGLRTLRRVACSGPCFTLSFSENNNADLHIHINIYCTQLSTCVLFRGSSMCPSQRKCSLERIVFRPRILFCALVARARAGCLLVYAINNTSISKVWVKAQQFTLHVGLFDLQEWRVKGEQQIKGLGARFCLKKITATISLVLLLQF